MSISPITSAVRSDRAWRAAVAIAIILLTAAAPAAAQRGDAPPEPDGGETVRMSSPEPFLLPLPARTWPPPTDSPIVAPATARLLRITPAAADSQRTGTLALTVGTAAGAAAGWLGGAYIGYELDREYFHWSCCDDPGLEGLIWGMVVGPAVTTPLAAHLANDRRGSLPLSYLASAGIAGVAALAVDPFVLVAPLAHVLTAVVIERDTS